MLTKIWAVIKKVLLFIVVVTISFWVLAFIAVLTGLIENNGIVGMITVFVVLIAPIVLGVFVVKKKYRKTTIKETPVPLKAAQPVEERIKSTVSEMETDDPVKKEETLIPAMTEKHSVENACPAEKTYRVAGTSFRKDNIAKLGVENDDYFKSKRELIDLELVDEKIWKYEFFSLKAEVIPEPDNQADPNAIMVWVNGQHVGYIKSGSCAHLLKAINSGRIRGIDCDIRGGPYKIITTDHDEDDDNEVYQLEKGEINYSVVLHIFEAPTA